MWMVHIKDKAFSLFGQCCKRGIAWTTSIRVLLVSGWVLPIELMPWSLTAVRRFLLAGW